VATILRRLADTGQLQFGAASGTVRTQLGTVTRFVGPGGVEFEPGAGTMFQGAVPGAVTPGSQPQAVTPQAPSVPKSQDTEVRIQADPRINAVVVRDLADRMPIYQRLIESLDRKQRLIELEVVIADVSSDRLVNLGVDWNFGIGGNHNGVAAGVGDVAAAALRQGLTFTTAITADPLSVLARLQALESRDEARVLSRPAVLTFDNVEALLDQSQSFFVPLTGERVANLAQVTVGLLVRVTPHIIDEGGPLKKVQMTIDIEDGAQQTQQQQTVTVENIPSVTQATLSTQGIVEERQALVVGGFYREQLQNNLGKVPVLGDIPVVGWTLFRSLNRQRSSATRLVMIRPLVVDETSERAVLSGSLTRDGPPVSLFRPDSKLGLTPEGELTLDEIRFGTLLGPSVMGRAEDTLCLARAMLSPECKAGPMPSLTVDPFPSVAVVAPTGPKAVPTPPALY
jgi:type II secretory pathway component GspD/PulD (secretin)